MPDWLAVIVHAPDAKNVTVPFANEQTTPLPLVRESVVVNPEVAIAVGE